MSTRARALRTRLVGYEVRLTDEAADRLPFLADAMMRKSDAPHENMAQVVDVPFPPWSGDPPAERAACEHLVRLVHEDYGRRFGLPGDVYEDDADVGRFEDEVARLGPDDLVARRADDADGQWHGAPTTEDQQ